MQAQKTVDIDGAGRDSGGSAGGRNHVCIRSSDGERSFGLIGGITLVAGSVLAVYIAGTGGFGSAYDRDPAAVLDDGLVLFDAAGEVYGVVISGKAVDIVQTSESRGEDPRPDVELHAHREDDESGE